MWWIFEKLEDNNNFVLYAYSRETKELDDRIRYDKANESMQVITPCHDDSSEFALEKAIERMHYLVSNGFPQRKMFACG